MPITHVDFVRSAITPAETAEVSAVEALVASLLARLHDQDRDINRAHVVGAQSAAIQRIVGGTLLDIGFSEEVVLTPQDGIVTRARPDFVRELGRGRGVMAEVERREQKYNSGKPFPDLEAGSIPRGRPMGE